MSSSAHVTNEILETAVLENPALRSVWEAWNHLHMPDCWLVAGCVAQTVWNRRFGLPPEHGIADVDLVYFDPSDLSEGTEQLHAERIRRLLPRLGVWLDVKNEARVHLWYEGKFGYRVTPYRSAVEAIATFPTTATAIGIRPAEGGAEICAPFGLTDLFDGVVRANKRQITRNIYEAKVSKWRARWPDLDFIDWQG